MATFVTLIQSIIKNAMSRRAKWGRALEGEGFLFGGQGQGGLRCLRGRDVVLTHSVPLHRAHRGAGCPR